MSSRPRRSLERGRLHSRSTSCPEETTKALADLSRIAVCNYDERFVPRSCWDAMGRRTLRKIHPELDLSRHLRALEELPQPLLAESCFGRQAPLEVEMGSGKGLFIVSASGMHPERDFLGVEVSKRYARYAAAKLAKAERSNAVMVAGDGLKLFHEYLPTASVDVVHVYFPDPWWKKRHRRRRVLNAPFLKDVERVLKPTGQLSFWTDVREYFESTLALIQETVALEGPLEVGERPAAHDLDYRTHFERRTRLDALPVYRAEYVKPG